MLDLTKELIALAAAVAIGSEPRVRLHRVRARRHGASESDLRTASVIARAVQQGAADTVDGMFRNALAGSGETRTPAQACCA